ncbi:MAG TPA: HDIG domain-containing protein [Ktedonobacterales bacterium]
MELSYENALALLRAHNQNESLVKHGMAVSICVAAYARQRGEDESLWRIAGLLHDVDYEEHPTIEEHGKIGAEWLRDLGYPESIVFSTHAHNDHFGIPRDDALSKTVYACDELAGLLVACALVRPGKTFEGMEASSVRKKMKDKAFARGVNRDDIIRGAQDLGVDLDQHISFCIQALNGEASTIGLGGVA